MPHRSTPERLEEAWHQATRNRLIGVGIAPARADEWIDAWAHQAARDGVEPGAGYWEVHRWT